MLEPIEPPPGTQFHTPVLLAESLDLLAIRPDGAYVDATLGGGGHSRAILDRLGPNGRLTAIDQDPDALRRAEAWGAGYGSRLRVVASNFDNLEGAVGREAADGILMDLGVSSHQLDAAERGFSFRAAAPLDMRMGQAGVSAADVVQEWPEEEIVRILFEYGEERYARRIARAIVRERARIATTTDLAELVRRAVPRTGGPERIHPATRTFQALRIAVNDELGALRRALDQVDRVLRPGGRIVVIAYHSLEDRIVKEDFRERARECICPPRLPVCQCGGRRATYRILTRKPVYPSEEETSRNPRARSARLRAAERLPGRPPSETVA